MHRQLLLACSLAFAACATAIWFVGCSCGEDQHFVEDPVVPPVIRSYSSVSPDSGLYEIDASDGSDATFYEVGTEADWLAMPCAQACARANTGFAIEELTKCRPPERASDGKLHLHCEWMRNGNCKEGRI